MGDSVSEDDNKHNDFWVFRDEAYEMGTREAADHPVIFIDPDKFPITAHGHNSGDRDSPEKDIDSLRADALRRQLEKQAPGSTEALLDWLEKRNGERPTLEDVAKELRGQGPMALSERLVIDGKEYGIAVNPPSAMNSKSEIVDAFTDHLDLGWSRQRAIQDNIPGTTNDWMRLLGNHEGTHLEVNQPNGLTNLGTLIEERRADQGAHDMARERGQGDISLAMKDLRSLAAHRDPGHATTPVVDQDDQVTELTFETARDYRSEIHDGIKHNFDFATYNSEGGGKATTPEELLKENPEAYFAAAQEVINGRRDDAVENYNDDLELFDNQREIVEAQLLIDYHKNFEDAFRRRVLGENIPERQPTQLISQEAEDSYLANMELHEKIMAMEPGIEGYVPYGSEFHSSELLDNIDWSTYPGEVENEYDLTGEERGQMILERLEEKKAEVVEDFKNEPTLESYERMMECQTAINESIKDINYGRYARGEELLEHQELITPVEKQEFLVVAVEEQERLAAIQRPVNEARDEHWNETFAEAYKDNGGTVFANFDWENYEGQATDPHSLSIEDPQTYFEHTIEALGTMRQEALDAYEADPSYENMGRLIEVQTLIDSNSSSMIEHDGEDGFDMNSIDVPFELSFDAPPLVSATAENEYYLERSQRKFEQEAKEEASQKEPAEEADKGYEKGVNGSAYTTKVEEENNGKPIVKFNEDGNSIETPNGKAMTQVFGEAVSPDPDSVALVDAKTPEVQDTPMPPPVENTMQADQGAMTV